MTDDDIRLGVEQTPAFVAIHSLDGLLLWANRITYGLDGKSLIGQPVDLLIFDEDKPHWWEAFRRAQYLRETSEYSVRIHVPSPPGWVRLSGRIGPVIRDDRVVYLTTVTYDVTFRDRAEVNPLAPFVLSPLSRQIVAALWPDAVLKGAALARRVDEVDARGQASSKLRVVLASLVSRNVLALTDAGYTITPAFLPHAAAALRSRA